METEKRKQETHNQFSSQREGVGLGIVVIIKNSKIMALDNLISVTLTEDEVQAINEAIASINNVLRDKVVNLSPEERRQYGSIADRNKILVDKCKDYMDKNPETIPNILDKAEFDRDYQTRKQMELPVRSLKRIIEKLEDTKTLLDHDNYQASIAYYRYIKFLSMQNEPGTTTIYKDLKEHYRKKTTQEGLPEATADTGE